MEETKRVGKSSFKGSMSDCFLFVSWFLSKKASEASSSIGFDFIGMVKTNTKGFFKATIEELTKGLHSGS